MARPTIEPNETHVLKATAWDALYAAYTIEIEAKIASSGAGANTGFADNMIAVMDKLLAQVADKYQNAKTWGEIRMRQFDNDPLCLCRACDKAESRDKWNFVGWIQDTAVHTCPNCGALQDASVVNKNPPDSPTEPDKESNNVQGQKQGKSTTTKQ